MNELIKEGDTAIVYLSFNQLYPIKVTKGLSHHTKYGSLKHSDLIGKKYGTKFKCSNGVVYVLQGKIILSLKKLFIYRCYLILYILKVHQKYGNFILFI